MYRVHARHVSRTASVFRSQPCAIRYGHGSAARMKASFGTDLQAGSKDSNARCPTDAATRSSTKTRST